MPAKQGKSRAHRNPILAPGVHRFGRSTEYHKKGLWAKRNIKNPKKVMNFKIHGVCETKQGLLWSNFNDVNLLIIRLLRRNLSQFRSPLVEKRMEKRGWWWSRNQSAIIQLRQPVYVKWRSELASSERPSWGDHWSQEPSSFWWLDDMQESVPFFWSSWNPVFFLSPVLITS